MKSRSTEGPARRERGAGRGAQGREGLRAATGAPPVPLGGDSVGALASQTEASQALRSRSRLGHPLVSPQPEFFSGISLDFLINKHFLVFLE